MDITDTSHVANGLEMDIIKTEVSRVSSVDFNNIPFGKIFSDHMFMVDYKDGKWLHPQIRPYGNLEMSPAISALHYGQAIFEGLKAYRREDGRILVFRPLDNFNRMNRSAERMCMPDFPEDLFMGALDTLLSLDKDWVPSAEGCSLYIRPVMFATTAEIKVKSAEEYKFVILTCPVGPYYPEPVRVLIQQKFTRACEGGVGYAKAAGNYGAALYPAKLAQDKGYHQLIWTDAKEHKYIEESGTMNIVFRLGDTLVTPPLDFNTILPGITRDSVLTLARSRGIQIEERSVTVDEIVDACKSGLLLEAFGAGTAATIAHIEVIGYNGTDYQLPKVTDQSFSSILLDELTSLRIGKKEDPYGWVYEI